MAMQLFSANMNAMPNTRAEEVNQILSRRRVAGIFAGNVALMQIKSTLVRIAQH